jgi:hypothetical protein
MAMHAKTFYCPDMVSLEDAMLVEQHLQNAPSIESVETDHAVHTVFVSCASSDGLDQIPAMLAEIGFPPEEREMAAGEVGTGTSDPSHYKA